jgi:hypothetical protein
MWVAVPQTVPEELPRLTSIWFSHIGLGRGATVGRAKVGNVIGDYGHSFQRCCVLLHLVHIIADLHHKVR